MSIHFSSCDGKFRGGRPLHSSDAAISKTDGPHPTVRHTITQINHTQAFALVHATRGRAQCQAPCDCSVASDSPDARFLAAP